jgi:hypothetical protein
MQMYQLAVSHYVSHCLALAGKLGIADQLAAGPRPIDALARATQSDASALRRVLRLLASVGVFEEAANGEFAQTSLSQLLCSDVPGSMRAMVSVFAGADMQAAWKELEYCVQTGQPFFKKLDPTADAFTIINKDPETAATFDKAMATFAPQTAAGIVAAYDFSRFNSLVDVGGGNGALLHGILNANPKLSGVLFDQPHVAERARAQNTSPRLEIVPGSFFESVPSGHDAYLLKHVIHDWDDSDATHILQVCRKAMPAHGTLLIVEGVYPEQVTASQQVQRATFNDVNMLVNTGGRQRSAAEFQQLLAAAALTLTQIVPTQGAVCLVEAKPALA